MSGYGKIYESSYWGVGVCENTIGWGSSYKSIANCTDASFSYPLDSYPTNGVNPTPTITGDAGGTFTATPSGLTLNASTGEITLSTSTVNSYTIRYTLPDATFAEQSMQITAPPFASTRSFSFDGVNDYFTIAATSTLQITGDLSFSCWFKSSDSSIQFMINLPGGNGTRMWLSSNEVRVSQDVGGAYRQVESGGTYTDGNWHLATGVMNTTSGFMGIYIDGVLKDSRTDATGTRTTANSANFIGSQNATPTYPFNGSIDEVAFWNSALSSDAVTEIYNSGVPNDLDELTNASDPTVWYRMGE